MRIRPHPISEFRLFAYPNNIQHVQLQRQRRCIQDRPRSAASEAPSAGGGGRYRGGRGYGRAPSQSRRTSIERTTGHAGDRAHAGIYRDAWARWCRSHGGQPTAWRGCAAASGNPLPARGRRVTHRATRHAKRIGGLYKVKSPRFLTNMEAYFTQLGFQSERHLLSSNLPVGADGHYLWPDRRSQKAGGEFWKSGRRYQTTVCCQFHLPSQSTADQKIAHKTL